MINKDTHKLEKTIRIRVANKFKTIGALLSKLSFIEPGNAERQEAMTKQIRELEADHLQLFEKNKDVIKK